MRYKYASHLSDLKDLRHIEWFLEHSDQYDFQSSDAQAVRDLLKRKIRNKNICYSEIVTAYEWLVEHFDNDPYNYVFAIEAEDSNKCVKSNLYYHYFVKVMDDEKRIYTVPYQYILDNDAEAGKRLAAKSSFTAKMSDCHKKAKENMNAVRNHYLGYWHDGGVQNAIERFESVGCGKGYGLPKLLLFYFLYNIVFFMILAETKYLGILTHFWQMFSESPSAEYSLMNVFSGRKIFGLILVIAVTYFLVMNVYYGYGLYYLIYIKNKYSDVVKYQKKLSSAFTAFQQDYKYCEEGIQPGAFSHNDGRREEVYIPLIEASNRRYNFETVVTVEEEDENGNKRSVKKMAVEPVIVPKKCFYSQPLRKRIIWILVLLVLVQAVCNESYILFY